MTWDSDVEQVVDQVARELATFTTDDVWKRLDHQPPEPRAIGNLMKRAARRGVCEATQAYTPSRRPECRYRPVRVWRSLICADAKPRECRNCLKVLDPDDYRSDAIFCGTLCKADYHHHGRIPKHARRSRT